MLRFAAGFSSTVSVLSSAITTHCNLERVQIITGKRTIFIAINFNELQTVPGLAYFMNVARANLNRAKRERCDYDH